MESEEEIKGPLHPLANDLTKIDPDEIPDVPANRFLSRDNTRRDDDKKTDDKKKRRFSEHDDKKRDSDDRRSNRDRNYEDRRRGDARGRYDLHFAYEILYQFGCLRLEMSYC